MKAVMYTTHFTMSCGADNNLTPGKKYEVHGWDEEAKSFYLVDDNDVEHYLDWLDDKIFDAKDYFKEVIKIDKR